MDENRIQSNPGVVQGDANEVASRAGEIARGGLEQARRLTSSTRDRMFRTADEKKGLLTGKLDELARNIDDLGHKAGGDDELPRKLVDGASRALRSVQRTLDERSTEELLDEAGRQIRQRPGLFLAGCLALGFMGARLLRK
jgi:hypothetical protein